MENFFKWRALSTLFIFLTTLDLTSSSGTSCKKTGICSCEISDGSGTIDLHPISSTSNSPSFRGIEDEEGRSFTYNYNPCKSFTMGTCSNVLACQVFESQVPPNIYYDIGSTMRVDYDTSQQLVMFVYDSAGKDRKTTFITLKCDEKTSTSTLDPFKEDPSGDSHYKTTLTSKYACPRKNANPKKKTSIGTILCILLLVIIVLYFALGVVFLKYYKKKEGSELIPNASFWKDLPSLIKDGFLFTSTKVRRKQSEYEEI